MGDRNPASPRPPALVASIAFGVVGALLLLIGFATDSIPILVCSGAAGTLSLSSALVWRSQLIEAWREQQGGGRAGPQEKSAS